jgi:hypothetical protein
MSSQGFAAMNTRPYRSPRVPLQQRVERVESRQQQQDNGTHEFQPTPQRGDPAAQDDYGHTLEAYLQRARQLGELPVPPKSAADAARRPDLRLTK